MPLGYIEKSSPVRGNKYKGSEVEVYLGYTLLWGCSRNSEEANVPALEWTARREKGYEVRKLTELYLQGYVGSCKDLNFTQPETGNH